MKHLFTSSIEKELDNFFKIYATKTATDDLDLLCSYLHQLLTLTTVSDLSGFYEATKAYNFTFPSFEKEIDRFDDVDVLKVRLIECFSILLERKFITKENR